MYKSWGSTGYVCCGRVGAVLVQSARGLQDDGDYFVESQDKVKAFPALLASGHTTHNRYREQFCNCCTFHYTYIH